MMCIFLLAKDVFGGRFIRRKETSKRAKSEKRCYNYFTDKRVVEVAIGLMNLNLRNLTISHRRSCRHTISRGGQKMTSLTETYQKSSATGAVLTYIVCHLCVELLVTEPFIY